MIFKLSNSQFTKFINFKNDFKDNLSLIILLPTFLGGVYQAIELIIISPSLIHFFSISQLIADGLFILVYFIILLLIPYLLSCIIIKLVLNKYPKSIKTYAFILFLLMIALLFLLKEKQELFERNIMLRFVVHLIICFISICFYDVIIRLFNINEINVTRWHNFYFAANIIITILLLSLYMYHVMSQSISIDNFEILKNKYTKNQKAKILYYNDKYIFLQIENNLKENKIHIEKIESILEPSR